MPSPEEITAAFEAYALAVGKVAHAWNYLQETLAHLFVHVLGVADRQVALAVSYSTDSDRAQQRMLRDAVNVAMARWPTRTKAKDDLIWLLKEVTALADHRNNAVHAPGALYIGGGTDGAPEIGPSMFPGHPRAKRLMGKRLIEEFEWYETWAETLIEFGRSVEGALAVEQNPWPNRPRRPVRGPKKTRPNPGSGRLRTK